MAWIQMSDLMHLAASEHDDPIEPLTQVFEWRHARMMTAAKGAAAFAATLGIGIVIGFLQGDVELGLGTRLYLLASGLVASLGIAGALTWTASRATRAYLAAITLIAEFSRIKLFLRQYLNR